MNLSFTLKCQKIVVKLLLSQLEKDINLLQVGIS